VVHRAAARTPLDGELWLGRGRFDELSGIVRKTVPRDAEWRQVRYMVFELPQGEGTFTERAQRIRALAAQTACPQLVAVEQAPVAETGFSDAQRRDPPAAGSVVTYCYRDLTATGLPRFASFLRLHHAL
jgi:DNA ligase-1